MRNWENSRLRTSLERSISSSAKQADETENGPELLLCPARRSDSDISISIQEPDLLRSTSGNRSTSGQRSRSSSISRRRIWADMCSHDDTRQEKQDKPLTEPYSIPVHDVIVLDTMGSKSNDNCPIFLTTCRMGYFEFTFLTSNAHDVFMAFLTNSLPSERITCAYSKPLDASSSFDVETLLSSRMHQRVEAETFPERLRRKINFMANRIGERELIYN